MCKSITHIKAHLNYLNYLKCSLDMARRLGSFRTFQSVTAGGEVVELH